MKITQKAINVTMDTYANNRMGWNLNNLNDHLADGWTVKSITRIESPSLSSPPLLVILEKETEKIE
jgi:hypothetical protein